MRPTPKLETTFGETTSDDSVAADCKALMSGQWKTPSKHLELTGEVDAARLEAVKERLEKVRKKLPTRWYMRALYIDQALGRDLAQLRRLKRPRRKKSGAADIED